MIDSYDGSPHLTENQLLQTYRNVYDNISLNDHMKICAWCGERFREMVEEILSEKVVVTEEFFRRRDNKANHEQKKAKVV